MLNLQIIHVVCMNIITNNDYFPIQHEVNGFYNGEGEFTAQYELNIPI